MMRKGLGKGLGSGYYNIAPRDPMVHSLSAKGIKSTVSLNMMGLAEINRMNDEATYKARMKNTHPYKITSQAQIDEMPPFPFPNIGDHIPDGYKKVNEYFVDSSGLGEEGEPALTVEQFKKKMKLGMSYAITSAGQFQVYVGEYEKTGAKPVRMPMQHTTNTGIGDLFFSGVTRAKANNMEIVDTPTETLLVGYGWAVYGARDKATGKVIYYDGWRGYSRTTSKQLGQTGLRSKADETRPFARKLGE